MPYLHDERYFLVTMAHLSVDFRCPQYMSVMISFKVIVTDCLWDKINSKVYTDIEIPDSQPVMIIVIIVKKYCPFSYNCAILKAFSCFVIRGLAAWDNFSSNVHWTVGFKPCTLAVCQERVLGLGRTNEASILHCQWFVHRVYLLKICITCHWVYTVPSD